MDRERSSANPFDELPFKRLSGAVRIKHGDQVAESTSYTVQTSFNRRREDGQRDSQEQDDYRDRHILLEQKRSTKLRSKHEAGSRRYGGYGGRGEPHENEDTVDSQRDEYPCQDE